MKMKDQLTLFMKNFISYWVSQGFEMINDYTIYDTSTGLGIRLLMPDTSTGKQFDSINILIIFNTGDDILYMDFFGAFGLSAHWMNIHLVHYLDF